MKNKILFTLCLSLFLVGSTVFGQTKTVEGQQAFWNSLNKLCGRAFAGEVVAAPEGDTTFAGKKLVMHIRACEENRIRIPFFVGGDRSRTWVLTRQENRLLLKHDHRHEDGKPDEVTNYGGLASNAGSTEKQVFPADAETARMLPAAASNVWWIELVEGEYFTYNLRRLGTDRFFSIKFDLSKEIETPEAPWGWVDVAENGKKIQQLTNHPAEDRYPSFSPDGKQILFESERNGNWDIFLMRSDGTLIRPIKSEPSAERFPSFSPDGKQIVFLSNRTGDSELYLMKTDGSGLKRLTQRVGDELFPAFSADGKSVSFTADLDLFQLDLNSLTITKSPASSLFRDVWLRWSPDGRLAAFFSRRDTENKDDEIYIFDVAQGKAGRITNRAGHDFCPAFSPDGNFLAVAAIDEQDERSIHILNLEGRIIARKGLGFERVTEPSFSPDGTKIIYTASRAGNYEIYVEELR